MYALVENGKIEKTGNIPKSWTLKNGSSISGFDLLSDKAHREEGWLPLEENKPAYDEDKEFLTDPEFQIFEDKVVRSWSVKELPLQYDMELYMLDLDFRLSLIELGVL